MLFKRKSQMIGEIVTVSYEPHRFTVKAREGSRIIFGYTKTLREKVREFGGQRVRVIFEGQISREGVVSEAMATNIVPIGSVRNAQKDYQDSPGDVLEWNTDEAQDYIDSLRPKDKE